MVCLKDFGPDIEIYNFYRPPEATVYCQLKKISYDESIDCVEGNVSFGGTLPGFDGQIAPPNEKGEIYIGGRADDTIKYREKNGPHFGKLIKK